jgi:hypothetical protein
MKFDANKKSIFYHFSTYGNDSFFRIRKDGKPILFGRVSILFDHDIFILIYYKMT